MWPVWVMDVLHAAGTQAHLAHPLGGQMFSYRKSNDVRDVTDLCDRRNGCAGRLPETYITNRVSENRVSGQAIGQACGALRSCGARIYDCVFDLQVAMRSSIMR